MVPEMNSGNEHNLSGECVRQVILLLKVVLFEVNVLSSFHSGSPDGVC
jgi:hypothetical protein